VSEREDGLFDDIYAAGEAARKVLDPEFRFRPRYYRRDGTLYVDTPEKEALLQWAEMFEKGSDRIVQQNITLYGERLSTVFLGIDHSFMPGGPPILFETMLFAPRSAAMKQEMRERLRQARADIRKGGFEALKYETSEDEKSLEKRFPHDNLCQRYATEAQALAGHNKLKLQCLIPPRWRRFLLYTIGKDSTWG
jgi:hypothetical protein